MDLLLTSVRVVISKHQPLAGCLEVCVLINEFADATECISFWVAVTDSKCHLLRARLLRGQWTERSLRFARGAMAQAAENGHQDVVMLMHELLPPLNNIAMLYLLKSASQSGNVQLMDWVHDAGGVANMGANVKKEVEFGSTVVDIVRAGSIDALQWIDDHIDWASNMSKDSMDWLMIWAATYGHLDILDWLRRHNYGKPTRPAMDKAAENGYLEAVKWFHTHSTIGCTPQAMTLAARNGHLDVVKWLHENRSEGCSEDVVHLAATNGQLEVVKWFHENRRERCDSYTIGRAQELGHIEEAEWLRENLL